MTPTRVLHVLATAHERGTAVSRVVGTFAYAIDAARYELHAWFLGGDGPLAAELRGRGIPVRTFAWNGRRTDPAGAWSFWRALKRQPFGIVHTHFGGRVVPLLIRTATDAKVVLHLHGGGAEAGEAGPLVVRPWSADRVIALSNAVACTVVGVQPAVVYHGIRIPERQPADQSIGLRRAVIGAASRLVGVKGIDHLLCAWSRVHHDFPSAHLEIAGAGPEEARLRSQVMALGLGDRVTFLGWQADMRIVYARWDIFVQPSLDEGFGMAALEAMAAGLPVIATAVGGLPELIEDGRTGYVVPPADAAALAARLRALLSDGESRHVMGAAGRARVRRCFSPARMAADLMGIYDALLPEARARPQAQPTLQ